MIKLQQKNERCSTCGGVIPEPKHRRVGGCCAACVGVDRNRLGSYQDVMRLLKIGHSLEKTS